MGCFRSGIIMRCFIVILLSLIPFIYGNFFAFISGNLSINDQVINFSYFSRRKKTLIHQQSRRPVVTECGTSQIGLASSSAELKCRIFHSFRTNYRCELLKFVQKFFILDYRPFMRTPFDLGSCLWRVYNCTQLGAFRRLTLSDFQYLSKMLKLIFGWFEESLML